VPLQGMVLARTGSLAPALPSVQVPAALSLRSPCDFHCAAHAT